MARVEFKELSHQVLGAVFSVHNILGPGLLESAYEGVLVIEFQRRDIPFSRQQVYPLYYPAFYSRISFGNIAQNLGSRKASLYCWQR